MQTNNTYTQTIPISSESEKKHTRKKQQEKQNGRYEKRAQRNKKKKEKELKNTKIGRCFIDKSYAGRDSCVMHILKYIRLLSLCVFLLLVCI